MVTRAQFSKNIPDLFDTIIANALGIGNVWFVDSGHDDASDTSGAGRSQSRPFATLAYAVGQVTAANGDTMFISPGHTENITAADGIRFAANAEGLHVFGLGQGTNRPQFTFTTVSTADIEIDAPNVTIRNCRFDLTGVSNLTNAIDVNDDHFTMIDCYFFMANAANQALDCMNLGADADFARILGCKFDALGGAGPDTAIEITTPDSIEIAYCWCDGNYDDACLHSASIFTDAYIHHNYLRNEQTGDHAIEFTNTCSGLLAYNMYHSTITAPGGVDTGAMFSIENYHADAVDVSGILDPVAT